MSDGRDDRTLRLPSVGMDPSPPHRRAPVVVAALGLVILAFLIGVVIALGGDDDEQSIDTPEPDRRAVTTTAPVELVPPPSLTTAPAPPPVVIVPPTAVTPGTVLVNPSPPASKAPTTAARPTSAPPPPTTTQPPGAVALVTQALADALDERRSDSPGDEEAAVTVRYRPDRRVTVSWGLRSSGDPAEARAAALDDSVTLLRALRAFDGLEYRRVILDGTLPLHDADSDGATDPVVVLHLVFARAVLDDIDFESLDPSSLLDLAAAARLDPALGGPLPTTTTSPDE